MRVMQSQDLAKYALPTAPGVYFFLGRHRKILYIGRATSLKDRVKSYFSGDLSETRGPLIVRMISEARALDWRVTDSVLEAVLLEADLIRKFKPPYNTDDKDDKSFNCVVITDEEFPRVLVVRKKDLDHKLTTLNLKLKTIFGPFPEGGKLSIALKLIRKIFPFRDKCTPCTVPRNSASILRVSAGCKPCFNRQIGLCPGVCTGGITAREYRKTIANIKRLFEGKKKSIVQNLSRDMKHYIAAQEFEKAAEVRRSLFALEHIQDVSLIAPEKRLKDETRIEAFDVAHTGGKEPVGVVVSVQNGIPDKSAYRTFNIRNASASDDIGALGELLSRRFSHTEWPLPDIVVVDGGTMQLNVAREMVSKFKVTAQIVSVVKDKLHRPDHVLGDDSVVSTYRKEILLANHEAHRFALSFHRRRRGRRLLS